MQDRAGYAGFVDFKTSPHILPDPAYPVWHIKVRQKAKFFQRKLLMFGIGKASLIFKKDLCL